MLLLLHSSCLIFVRSKVSKLLLQFSVVLSVSSNAKGVSDSRLKQNDVSCHAFIWAFCLFLSFHKKCTNDKLFKFIIFLYFFLTEKHENELENRKTHSTRPITSRSGNMSARILVHGIPRGFGFCDVLSRLDEGSFPFGSIRSLRIPCSLRCGWSSLLGSLGSDR